MQDKDNTADKGITGLEEYSSFESAYWRMLISRADKAQDGDDYSKYIVEGMFDLWNERFGTDVKPMWLQESA